MPIIWANRLWLTGNCLFHDYIFKQTTVINHINMMIYFMHCARPGFGSYHMLSDKIIQVLGKVLEFMGILRVLRTLENFHKMVAEGERF